MLAVKGVKVCSQPDSEQKLYRKIKDKREREVSL